MKLFGWMHQKIRQHSIDPFKDFTIGNCCTCLSHQSPHDGFYQEPSYYKSLKHNDSECQLSIPNLNTKKIEDPQQVLSETSPDFFHSFLAIGTLGSQLTLSEPATPTFGVPSGNIAEMDIEVTENELKVINDELDKFLEAEAKEEGCDESGRNSFVSVVTLGGKQMEEKDSEEYEKLDTCPLQGYLLGSSIELPESRIDAKKEKASLRELFQMTKLSDEYLKLNFESDNKQPKELRKSNMPLIKKMLHKLQISSGSSGKTTRKEASHSVPTNNKFKKVLHMFHKRIHPETLRGEKEKKYPKHEINSTIFQGYYDNEDFSVSDENKRFPQGFMSKGGSHCISYISGLHHNGDNSGSFSGNREQWIKTDSDYLVLEL